MKLAHVITDEGDDVLLNPEHIDVCSIRTANPLPDSPPGTDRLMVTVRWHSGGRDTIFYVNAEGYARLLDALSDDGA